MQQIYLDYNATTPLATKVIEAMRPCLENVFGNPSSTHSYGVAAQAIVSKSRQQVATMLGANIDEIIFTSGGTEANNLAIKGYAQANQGRGNHIITCVTEHPAVLAVCDYLEKNGFEVTYLPVDKYGIVSVTDFEKAIRPTTILATIMHANNETGTIAPIRELTKIAKKHQIAFHCDAAQSVGKLKTDVNSMGVDMLSIAGHKLYGPKGVGALYIRRGIILQKQLHGANHEQNIRPGTENILEICGLGMACELVSEHLDEYASHMQECREALHKALLAADINIKLNGHPSRRLPNTLNISFFDTSASVILAQADFVAASAGAACHADGAVTSPVLTAMGVDNKWLAGAIRFSTGRHTSLSDIEQVSKKLINLIKNIVPPTLMDTNNCQLTKYTSGGGCVCKINPRYLEDILSELPIPESEKILAGIDGNEDAAVYQINDDTALVVSLDFFTPIVDNPYHFGQIAAANALSDIYAMGATPLLVLNIVAFPTTTLSPQVLKDILKGAADTASLAGISILGGHSIEDRKPKFGMAVVGTVHPARIWKNSNARTGDVLMLTKPIGTGILTSALQKKMLTAPEYQVLIKTMTSLNNKAANIIKKYNCGAVTDVTGFGLLGHLYEIVCSSYKCIELEYQKIPFLPRALELATGGIVPGGSIDNLDYYAPHCVWNVSLSTPQKYLLADAQTSGGLLFTIAKADKDALLAEFNEQVVFCAEIGQVVADGGEIIIK